MHSSEQDASHPPSIVWSNASFMDAGVAASRICIQDNGKAALLIPNSYLNSSCGIEMLGVGHFLLYSG